MAIDYARYYRLKVMSKGDLANAVALNNGDLTAAQYTEITGEEYVAPVINSVIKDIQTRTAEISAALYFNSELAAKRIEDNEAKIEVLEGGSAV